ncbi:MAG: hypothetical protein LC104_10580 [Bacteroidales bacterium]|nr:hypothetical protein [Bacteroidales bacterium]
MNESTAFDEVMEEGERRGKLKRSHHLLLLLGQQRFGEPDTATTAEIQAIQDMKRLERMSIAILIVNSWSALLATP